MTTGNTLCPVCQQKTLRWTEKGNGNLSGACANGHALQAFEKSVKGVTMLHAQFAPAPQDQGNPAPDPKPARKSAGLLI